MIGIDILENERIEKQLQTLAFWNKVLLENEQEYVKQFTNPTERFAGIFCVKEAVKKALGQPEKVGFLDIEVFHLPSGKPQVKYVGEREEFKNKKLEISISHSKTVTVAVAILIN
ncbi:MAG: holo-ACP synthase [Christensenellales bacterium]|jgi:holo-[acyl-carrier protein] synthase